MTRVNRVMIFHHIAKEVLMIVVQDIQYFGAASNMRVENLLAGLAGDLRRMQLSAQQKAPGGNASRSLPGLCSKWYAQNATFMNSATQHKITASGT